MLLTSDLRPSLPLHLIPLAVSTEYSPSLLRIFPTFFGSIDIVLKLRASE